MRVRSIASIPKKTAISTRRKRCCISTRWSASIAARAFRCARFRRSSPSTTCRKSGRNTPSATPSTLAGKLTQYCKGAHLGVPTFVFKLRTRWTSTTPRKPGSRRVRAESLDRAPQMATKESPAHRQAAQHTNQRTWFGSRYKRKTVGAGSCENRSYDSSAQIEDAELTPDININGAGRQVSGYDFVNGVS